MAWLGRVRSATGAWLAEGLDVLLPPHCAFCDGDLTGAGGGMRRGPAACARCAAALTRDGERCRLCGAPASAAGCTSCRGRGRAWNGIAVLGSYGDDDLRTAVLRAKRPAGARVAAALAALLVQRHRETLAAWAPDVVVHVPMHWLRRAARGANAADEIARGVASGLGLPRRRFLARTRPTAMQNTVPAAERRDNVRGAFRVRGRIAGLRVLLVDDVMTTGSTLEACGEAAVSAGAAAVYAAAIARADAGSAADA